jgi:glutathione S-transferase
MHMPARYTLHGSFRSGPTYKVALFLSLAGEPFDWVLVKMREGEHKQPAYLAKQRFGQVPLLVDNENGRHLCQSASILEYLADRTGKFGGADLDERIRAREWMFWDFDRLAPHIYRPRAARAGLRQFDPAVLAQHETEGKAALKVLDNHLAGREWLVGDGPTIADIDVYGVVAYAAEGGYDVPSYANLSAWMKRVQALPGFAPAEALLPQATKAAA